MSVFVHRCASQVHAKHVAVAAIGVAMLGGCPSAPPTTRDGSTTRTKLAPLGSDDPYAASRLRAIRAAVRTDDTPLARQQESPRARDRLAPREAASVLLPRVATDPILLTSSHGVSASIRMEGMGGGGGAAVRPTAQLTAEGLAVYAGALGPESDVILRVDARGVEDFSFFHSRPEIERLSYEIELVSHVAGVRFVGGVIELLDEQGTPRLHAEPPYVIDVSGARHDARLSIHGCRVSTDPRGPWGNPIVPPGARSCRVVVDWTDAKVSYPAIVDPGWKTTQGSMAFTRSDTTLVTLPNGKVLAAGSYETTAAELFDPLTETWATTNPTTSGHSYATAIVLKNGRALLSGGYLSPSSLVACEIYDPASGMWSPGPAMKVGRSSHTLTQLEDGRILAAGGYGAGPPYEASAEVVDLNAATPQWTLVGNLALPRDRATGTLLANGKVLIAGGQTTSYANAVASVDLFNPATNQFEAGQSMLRPRHSFTATRMPDGTIIAVGGGGDAASAERYDPLSNKWTLLTPMHLTRIGHTANLLPNGQILVAAGSNPGWLRNAEAYDPISAKWIHAGPLNYSRMFHASASLQNGKVLLASGGPPKATEVFQPEPAGQTCVSDGECTSGFCTDGFCCDTRCDGTCLSCAATLKGEGGGGVDGQCGPTAALTDPDDECPTSDPSTCGLTGTCDGHRGACAVHKSGTPCGPASCAGVASQNTSCDGAGSCVQVAKTCTPFVCADTITCKTSCTAATSNIDCAQGFRCEPRSSQCVPLARSCDGEHLIYKSDGTVEDCAPFGCAGESCNTSCASANECAPRHACGRDRLCHSLDEAINDSDAFGLAGCAIAPRPATRKPANACMWPMVVVSTGLLYGLLARRKKEKKTSEKRAERVRS